MRRSTLSTMNGGHANSRASLDSRASMGPSRKTGGGARMSMQPSQASRKSAGRQSLAGGRRSSAYGGGGAPSSRMRDPRDLKSKAFMNDTIRKVIIYLSERGTRTSPPSTRHSALQPAAVAAARAPAPTGPSPAGYDHAISPKILSAPTSTDFINMYQFLVRQIDP